MWIPYTPLHSPCLSSVRLTWGSLSESTGLSLKTSILLVSLRRTRLGTTGPEIIRRIKTNPHQTTCFGQWNLFHRHNDYVTDSTVDFRRMTVSMVVNRPLFRKWTFSWTRPIEPKVSHPRVNKRYHYNMTTTKKRSIIEVYSISVLEKDLSTNHSKQKYMRTFPSYHKDQNVDNSRENTTVVFHKSTINLGDL